MKLKKKEMKPTLEQGQSLPVWNLLLEKVRSDIAGEMAEKQALEDKIRLVVVRKECEQLVHQMGGFLIPVRRK